MNETPWAQQALAPASSPMQALEYIMSLHVIALIPATKLCPHGPNTQDAPWILPLHPHPPLSCAQGQGPGCIQEEEISGLST